MISLPPRPKWHAWALCSGATSLFFSPVAKDMAIAQRVCDACPVRQQCSEAGREEIDGVWGGESEDERRRKRVKPREVGQCGTRAGYQRHLLNGEPVCPACRTSTREYERLRSQRRRARRLAVT